MYVVKFWLKRSQAGKNGKAPIICRQGYGKKDYKDIPTDTKVLPENWFHDAETGVTAVVNCPDAERINKVLAKMKLDLSSIEEKLRVNDRPVNGEIIKAIYEEKGAYQETTLLEILSKHNDKYLKTVEENSLKPPKQRKKGFSMATHKKYVRLQETVDLFLSAVYRRSDIYLYELNYKFAEDFYDFLTSRGLNDETIRSSYWAKLKKIIENAVKRGEIKKFPFGDFYIKPMEVVQKDKLDEYEIIKILEYRFDRSPRLERIRHRALLHIFTGLSYIDLENLHDYHFHRDISGTRYISKERQKTGVESIIPIYPMIEDIIDYYLDSATERDGKFLPKLSNKVFADYLRELLDIIGITGKDIKPSGLRSSFSQVQIDSGTDLEAIAKMIGHKDTKTLMKHYGVLSKKTVMNHKDKVTNSFKLLKNEQIKQAN